MKHLLVVLLLLVISFIVTYLLGGLISMEWDIADWETKSRAGWVALSIMIALFGFMLYIYYLMMNIIEYFKNFNDELN